MKTFEYVTILLSIMLGFCFTQMASNFVLVVQNFGHAKFYAPSILWNSAAMIALLGHWTNFYKAANNTRWNAFQLTIVFMAPLIYFIPAQMLSQSPEINGILDFEVIFESNKRLIYGSVIGFLLCTIAGHYAVYHERNKFIYLYYTTAAMIVFAALLINSKVFDHALSVTIVIAEALNHYVFNPLKLAPDS